MGQCVRFMPPQREMGGEFPLSRQFQALIGSTTSEWDDVAYTLPKTGQTGLKSARMAQAGAVFAQNGEVLAA